jgi:hypothetical protein
MSITSEYPFEPRPGSRSSGGGLGGPSARGAPPSLAGSLLGVLAILAGSVIAGLAGGLLWANVAPRAVYVVVARGSADVVNPETSAFIAADAWYCLIGAAGGVIVGLAGYLLAVRRYGPAPMAAILAGSVVAALAARWVGEHQGLNKFDRQLLTVHGGTLVHAPLALAGDTSTGVWPAAASLPALAFWPLAACTVAGGIVLLGAIRARSAARPRGEPTLVSPQFPLYPDEQ